MSMRTYIVTWSNIYDKNINGRKYAPDCFENAIKKLGCKMLPVYASVDFDNKSVDPPIGYAHNFTVNDDKLSVQVDLYKTAPDIVGLDICLAGKGDSTWTEKDGSGFLYINPDTYEFNCLYPAKKSAFSVSMELVGDKHE